MERLPELITERLVLRGFQLSDAPVVQALAGAYEVAHTTLNIPHPYPANGAEEWISTHAEGIERGTDCSFAVVRREDSAVMGAIGLHIETRHNKAETGYWLGVPYWGQGYATEALQRIIVWGFEERGLNRIYAGYFVRNPASRRVQEKSGMQFEGIRRGDLLKNSVYEDHGMCAITRQDYLELQKE